MIKRGFRYAVGFFTVAPFMALLRLLAPLLGDTRALRVVGPMVTAVAKATLRLSMPRIRPGEDFEVFSSRLQRTLWWRYPRAAPRLRCSFWKIPG